MSDRISNNSNSDILYTLVFSFIAIILWIITLLRAANTGITYDEAFSFMHFFNFSIANNHPLNTVLILAFTFFTRLYFNELVIRLPNLLFYALYLIVAVKFSACFKNRILAFSLLAFNYYLSEYFGLARGYGIAAALVLTGLYLYYNRRGDPQSILYALIAFVAACSANYSLLAFLGCFVLYTFYFDIRLANLPAFIKRYWPHFALMLIAVAGMAYCFIQVTQEGLPLVGSRDTFFNAVILNYVQMFLPGDSWARFIAYGILLYYLTAVAILRKDLLEKPFTILCLLDFGLTAILAALFKRPLPTGRVLLPLWPLVALSLIEMFEALWIRISTKPWAGFPKWVMTGLALVLLVHFVLSVRFNYTTDCKEDYAYRDQVYQAAWQNKQVINKPYSASRSFYIYKMKFLYGIDLTKAR